MTIVVNDEYAFQFGRIELLIGSIANGFYTFTPIFGQLYDGIVGLLGRFFEMRGKVLAVALQTLEIDNPLFLFTKAENSIGVLVLIVEFPVFGIEFRLQVGIFVMDVGQEADFGDSGFRRRRSERTSLFPGSSSKLCMT